MGVWMIGTGSITIKPQVDEVLIKEYIQFSKSFGGTSPDSDYDVRFIYVRKQHLQCCLKN